MAGYSAIIIIYNPKSTGSGKKLADRLQASLQKSMPKQNISLTSTRHAGHAKQPAYEASRQSPRPLIISASGDGGYNEVLTGAIRAIKEGYQPTIGLLPAGNANDHYHSLHTTDIAAAILRDRPQAVDVLRMTVHDGATTETYYAHSYIGLGLTPHVGRKLTAAKLNKFNEMWLTAKTLFTTRHCTLLLNGSIRKYDNFVISNIPHMAKILTLARNAKIDDGLFEVTTHEHRGRVRMILHLLKASSTGLATNEARSNISFQLMASAWIQTDGEVINVLKGSTITITCLPKAIRCFV